MGLHRGSRPGRLCISAAGQACAGHRQQAAAAHPPLKVIVILMPARGMGRGGGGDGFMPHMAPLRRNSEAGIGFLIHSISWLMVTQ